MAGSESVVAGETFMQVLIFGIMFNVFIIPPLSVLCDLAYYMTWDYLNVSN